MVQAARNDRPRLDCLPLTKGKYEGAVLDREKFEQMKDEYYEQRGWDKATGIPTREKLVELGLEDVAAEVLDRKD